MKVYILTDLEGVAGVALFERQTCFHTPGWIEARELLTGEVNAAVEGVLAGGASDVYVWDGHGGGGTILFSMLHPAAKFIHGYLSKPYIMDETFDALLFVGQHAMNGVPGACLSHTYTMDISNMWLNEIPVGEFGYRAALAGSFGIRTIMLSGDDKACAEATSLIPRIETAQVKIGISRQSAVSLTPPVARKLIRETAEKSVKKIREIEPFKLNPPYTLRIEFANEDVVHLLAERKKKGSFKRITGRVIEFYDDNLVTLFGAWHS